MHRQSKARAPYEFGCKVSVATSASKPTGGQFVLHANALYGSPFDGHTLGPVVAELDALTGIETRRIHVDKDYRSSLRCPPPCGPPNCLAKAPQRFFTDD
jgi:IS5 family transposase